jgi:flavin reductase (DIM6/NTAB) family NADH-FMN oxidoreductase RutF
MHYVSEALESRDRYKLLTALIVPRPIAWVTSLSPTGAVNAAPFSFFNVFSEDPPIVMIALNKRPDGRTKDTQGNILRSKEFVVQIADEPLAEAMHKSSGDFPPDVSEIEQLGLTLAPSVGVGPPRIATAPFALECRLWKVIEVGDDRVLIMGEGIHFHVRDDLWDHERMRVRDEAYFPVGRMFADRYVKTRDRLMFPPV